MWLRRCGRGRACSRACNEVAAVNWLRPIVGMVLPAVLSGHIPPPGPDEGTSAHIFQLSIVALVPVGLLFLATADWTQPVRSVRRLAFPAAAVVLAFGILY